MEYSKELRKIREKYNLSQSALAKATGLNQQMISWWEDERNIEKGYPSIKHCVILADFYGITVDELIGHELKKNW